ncbi:hypothetical protein CAOG_07416 [Capsaspora owczarzaki ATCC 30864]|uniref:Autophagy-related protein 27 n=1 Tax=Capsaspora owczarzaki (strain ATCC 30864) TaxID=595528 RepID=A0A0D2WXR8_CAPO3|nr:hypothetical protein CAOG_07416 [Capsaspora owczarzaki ATCC 30864]KJE97583.1 hypothetical protein CAOG_007416 [Capsaspora owczarzaki ATCC 30864]|eukprot:XP_004343275.2 hypothetical protein CAOG_07416 [Capsaspora owczarzaki ATCC 30864]
MTMTRMLLALVALAAVAIVAAPSSVNALPQQLSAAAAAATPSVNVCKFADWETGLQVDLSALRAAVAFNNAKNWKYSTKDASGTTSYYLNVCDQLVTADPELPVECANSYACQSASNHKNFSAGTQIYNSGIYVENIDSGIIMMKTIGGTACSSGARSTIISFICDPRAHSLDGPEDVDEDDHCVYEVDWPTKHACTQLPSPATSTGYHLSIDSTNGETFDFSKLRKLVGNWVVNMPNGTFVLNVGQPINGLDFQPSISQCSPTSGACHLWSDTDPNLGVLDVNSRSLGISSTGRIYFDANGKLNYNMTGGSVYSSDPKCKGIARSINIRFECSSQINRPQFLDESNCGYHFLWASIVACPVVEGEGSDSSLSGFAIFVIIFLVLVFTYCFGGCCYKRHKLDAKGWEQIPNYDLWSKCCSICDTRRNVMERTRTGR